jgi:hypothetical protein
MDALLYHNKPMQAGACTPSLDRIVSALKGDEPVMVLLEPGDATRYTLLLVPTWAREVRGQLAHYGVPEDEAHRYLLVTKLDGDHSGQMAWASKDVGPWDLPFDNEWTRELLTWWLRSLWELL